MEKFGLFDIISKFSGLNTQNSADTQQTKTTATSPVKGAKISTQSAKMFLLRHEELSKKIDKNIKK